MDYMLRVFGLFSLVVAFIIVPFLYDGYQARSQVLNNSFSTTGEVVKLQVENEMFFPVYRYQDHQGNMIEGVSTSGSRPPSEAVGDIEPILVFEEDPHVVTPDNFMSKWFVLTLGFGVTLITFLTGASCFVVSFLINRDNSPGIIATRRVGFNIFITGIQNYTGFSRDKSLKKYGASWPLGRLICYKDYLLVGTELKKIRIDYENIVSVNSLLFNTKITHSQDGVPENVWLYGFNHQNVLRDLIQKCGLSVKFE